MRGQRGRFAEAAAIARVQRLKAERRHRARELRDRFQRERAAWLTRRMAISRTDIEWRVRLLTGPDTRSLTGKLMGDPYPLRSSLHARRMGWI